MGDPKGFMKYARCSSGYRPVCERLKDYNHVTVSRTAPESREQALRCMDCGTPFCHWACPVGNYIPEWNDLLSRGAIDKAFELLDATNNFPEITGRVCPALCEYACVLGTSDEAVTIRENELAVSETAFEMGYVRLALSRHRTGKEVAIVGSGPAGLACAMQLNRAGHLVTVFERDDRIGGILRYGIPDFKLEKKIVDRRINILTAEGVKFKTGVDVGGNYSALRLTKNFDAVCLAMGSRVYRDVNIEGRNLKGIYPAMDYLSQSNRRVSGDPVSGDGLIDVKGKKVVVIGGGDTGSDCVGTANRQGASCVIQIELLPKPPENRPSDCPWPGYPMLLKTSSSHEEGADRIWSVMTKKFSGMRGKVEKILCSKVEFSSSSGKSCSTMKEIPGSEFEIAADMVLIAIGFIGNRKEGLIEELGLELDDRCNMKTDNSFMTKRKGVFAAGDTRRGQSLVVWAISEGRRAAHCIDKYLMGRTRLPNI